MIKNIPLHDYSLTGEARRRAIEAGLVSASWYQSTIPRKTMKELMRRKDGPAIRDTLLWFALLGLSAVLGYLSWGTWLAVPCFWIYGVLYGSASDSRWHECSHGTAFKTRWMNDVLYQIASFMVMREPKVWKWSHARHHTDTIIIGRDREIAAPRPVKIGRILLGLFGIPQTWATIKSVVVHAGGRLTADEKDFIPEMERPQVFWTSRLWMILHLGIIGLSLGLQSWLPAMFIGILPTLYGAWLSHIFGITQHAGLAENVLDHRQNSRTIKMNPLLRFLYWNMNYHIEHHMFPMVPYHALPKLHEAVKHDMPPVYRDIGAAFREILPALWRQRKDPNYFVERPMPTEQAEPEDGLAILKTA